MFLLDDGVIIVCVLKILCDELLKGRDLLQSSLAYLGRPGGARHAHIRDVARVTRLPGAGLVARAALARVCARRPDGPGAGLLGQGLEARLHLA